MLEKISYENTQRGNRLEDFKVNPQSVKNHTQV